ncbi:hypothetical protein ACTFIR_005853 [Dictyostelium discoideum]
MISTLKRAFNIREDYQLSRRIRKIGFKSKRILETVDDENELIKRIEIAAYRNQPFSKKEALEEAFLAENNKDIPGWIQQVRELIINNKIKQSNIINYDEKGVSFTKSKKKVCVVVKDGNNETRQAFVRKQTQTSHFTIVGGITATGEKLEMVSILQKPKIKKWSVEYDLSIGHIEINETGYVDEEFKRFYIERIRNQFPPDETILVLCDNHSSNFNPDFLSWCSTNKVIVKYFPSNLTHILQPLDLVIFSSFTNHLNNLIDKERKEDASFVVKPKHYQILSYYAWCSAATPVNIMEAWNKTGILSWRPTQRLDQSLIPIENYNKTCNVLVPITADNLTTDIPRVQNKVSSDTIISTKSGVTPFDEMIKNMFNSHYIKK